MYLHKAISTILKAEDDRGLTVKEIYELNKKMGLYLCEDRTYPSVNQIHARVNQYLNPPRDWFNKKHVPNDNIKVFLGPKAV